MAFWQTEKNGKIDRVIASKDSPGQNWIQVPDDNRAHGDKLEWYDNKHIRIPDTKLVEQGIRKDNCGIYYSKEKIGETKKITELDQDAGDAWTKEKPLENEAYQKWDVQKKKWIVDAKKKEIADAEKKISEKQAAIKTLEEKIQRPLIAKQAGIATDEDEEYFTQLSTEILSTREELRQLAADKAGLLSA